MSALPPPYDLPTQDEGYNPAPASFAADKSNLVQQPRTVYQPAHAYQQPVQLVGYQPTSPQYNPQPYAQQSTSSNVVVVNQPTPTVAVSSRRPVGDHYLTLSIVMTVLCVMCGHWHSLLCTVPAILYSIKARDAEQVGDIVTAKSHARVSLILNIVSIVVWIISGTLIGISVIIMFVVALFARK